MTIGGATRVACVIGDPVEHSRSPLMHNAASAALGLDRVYVALHVAAADLEIAIRGLAALGFDGANVTLPHKAGAAALCDELGAEARDAGAVNTLSFAAGSGVRGDSGPSHEHLLADTFDAWCRLAHGAQPCLDVREGELDVSTDPGGTRALALGAPAIDGHDRDADVVGQRLDAQ